jgi:hypothetical protein
MQKALKEFSDIQKSEEQLRD